MNNLLSFLLFPSASESSFNFDNFLRSGRFLKGCLPIIGFSVLCRQHQLFPELNVRNDYGGFPNIVAYRSTFSFDPIFRLKSL